MLADTQPVGLSFVKLVGGMNGDHGNWQPRSLPRLLLRTFPSDGDERSRVSSGVLSLSVYVQLRNGIPRALLLLST